MSDENPTVLQTEIPLDNEPLVKKIIREIDVSNFDPTPYTDPNVIRPLPKQADFLLSHNRAKITFYGGAAGSAKTVALMYDLLQHVNDPNFEAVFFRRTTKQLKGAGGLWGKCSSLYRKLGAEAKESEMKCIFPQGSTARFTHLEHDKDAQDNHQGLEYSAIYFDELGRFSRYQFTYLLSRLRSNADVQSFVKATMNPEPDSWLLDYVEWYLTEDGYADVEKSGTIRWFVSDPDSGELDWADDPNVLRARHGNDCDPMSFTFIAATIADNPVLCKLQPGYLTALKNLPRVDREILLYGNWYAVPEASGYFKRDWVNFVEPNEVPRMKKVIRCWDFASSVESEVNPDPDYSAGVKIGLGEDGLIYVLHATKFRERPAGVLTKVKNMAEFDGRNCPVGIPLDPGHAGEVAFQNYAKPLILNRYKVKKMKTRKGKVERFIPFSNAAENGMVRIVKGKWNKDYFTELERFTGENKREHDDQVDATSDCYNWLVSGKQLPKSFRFKTSNVMKKNLLSNF